MVWIWLLLNRLPYISFLHFWPLSIFSYETPQSLDHMFCCMVGRLTMSSKDSRQELEQNATIMFIMFKRLHVDITRQTWTRSDGAWSRSGCFWIAFHTSPSSIFGLFQYSPMKHLSPLTTCFAAWLVDWPWAPKTVNRGLSKMQQ